MSASSTSPAVEAKDLGRRFGSHWALAHVDLALEQGKSLLLAGPNGSGKTTLLRLLAGLHKPSSGSLRIFGEDPIKNPVGARRRLSLVSHDNFLYGRLSALENLRISSRLLGLPSAVGDIMPLLEEVGLESRCDVPVAGFSAGMKKRLSLIRTRLEDPQMVLLDEPYAALDPAGQALVEDWVKGFQAKGRTVVVASHNLARAPRLCEEAVQLTQGQILWRGPASELAERMEAQARLGQAAGGKLMVEDEG